MCEVCANTLKKNQIKRHAGQCNSREFTCVDCSQTFSGRDLDNHTVCKSEAEKYFGKFYTGKDQKAASSTSGKEGSAVGQSGGEKKEKKEGQVRNGDDDKNEKNKKSRKIEEDSDEIEEKKTEKSKENEQRWKGWKNEIKYILKEHKEGIEAKELKKLLLKKHKKSFGNKEGIDEMFKSKIKFSRFVSKGNMVFYYRYLKGEE